MGTDRELLEKAAKAAGLKVQRSRLDDRMHRDFLLDGNGPRNPGQKAQPWNPLTDDGDALRLAVRLNMRIHIEADSAGCITIEWDFDEGGRARQSLSQEAPMGGDDYAATRRAIVRAAAAMPEGGQG